LAAVFPRAAAGEPEAPRLTPWALRPTAQGVAARQPQAPSGEADPEAAAGRLAEAHARGRAEGFAEGLREASDRHALEIKSVRQQALIDGRESQLGECARLEEAIRGGLAQIEHDVGAAVARILRPFLSQLTVQRVIDELARNIAKLCAGGAPGLITIRGSERLLALLRPRIADLPVDFQYVEWEGEEVIVASKPTQIVADFRPWAELLASLDA
jgi:hypothetical protein